MERKIISHRANLNGPDKTNENTLQSITKALDLGFDVEVDVWYEDRILYIGHDYEDKKFYKNLLEFLLNNSSKLWIHCKNIEALIHLQIFRNLNLFGHDFDNYVLTSNGGIFCKPGYPSNKGAIIVMPEMAPVYKKEDFDNCYGVVSDYPISIRDGDYSRFGVK